MIKIKFIGKQSQIINFKNSFAELKVFEFCELIKIEEKIDSLLIEVNKMEAELNKMETELKALRTDEGNLTNLVIIIDANLNDLDRQIRSLKVESLVLLSNNPKKILGWLLNTRGITQDVINKAYYSVQKGLGDFKDFIRDVKPVRVLRFTDYKKSHIFNFTKVKVFEVFDMDNQTVLRDAAANIVAAKIDAIKTEIEGSNRWDNLARFIAYVCRPATEKEEISTEDKKAFFGGTRIARLNVDDRLKAYNDLLAKEVDCRTSIFSRLPFATAIGIYKQYFFLSRR